MRRLIREEKGQALVLVLILLLVGGLIIAPLLDLMGTGLKVGKGVYENKMYEIYAADAGVEHALSLLKYDDLVDCFPDYDEYDYFTQWDYNLEDHDVGVGELVNEKSVHVTIENVWIPKDIPTPDTAPPAVTARQIVEEGKLIITGGPSVTEESTYEIKLSYEWTCGDDLLLDVNTIGIWLPPGFEYNGNCSLEDEDYYPEPQIDAYKGGYAVVWNFASVRLTSFPGDDLGPPMLKSFTFQYTGPPGQSPDNAVSWIDTSGADIGAATYTWDADVKIYKILSVAGGCEVEAYAAQIEMRKLGAAISGDYHAIGNTLMTCTSSYCPYYRNRLYKESSATVTVGDIPSNAIIEAAWLYWSGWIEGGGGAGQEVWSDSCGNFNNWIPGSRWSTLYGEFRCYGGGSDAVRTLTMHISGTANHCLDLSPYSGQEVTVSWLQREVETGGYWEDLDLESGDCLKYAFSKDGGTTWSGWDTAFCDDNPSSSFSDTIPEEYLTDRFKMRFLLTFDATNEYCYIDDITITASVSGGSSVEDARVNRVMFNGNQITADEWQVESTPDSGAPDSWCYSCFYDATDIVTAALDPDTKSGTFTLGHWLEGSGYNLYPSGTTGYPLATPASCTWGCMQYQWTYAGWSLVIIYSSSETQGHQLYLFDTLRYVAVHTSLDFPISGFLVPDPVGGEQNAAHITCFVGDGDEHYPYDFIALLDAEPSVPSYQIDNDYKLWDGITCDHNSESNPNNVWNSQSPGLAANGVDIDTFQVPWSSGLLEPGNTSAWVELGNSSSNPLDGELIVLVYIIMSFRSSTTSGGSISYLIEG
ncbi:MAG: hypothetical protein HXY36_07390 [Chloroflexi bacterium]|nr:hypothetical protein [Chloroflexota bacterium]